jgi:DNA replication protein DnaC
MEIPECEHCNVPGWMRRWSFESSPLCGNSTSHWAVATWVLQREIPGLVLWGPPGTGKSGLAVSALRTLLASDLLAYPGYWRSRIMTLSLSLEKRGPARCWYEDWSGLLRRLRSWGETSAVTLRWIDALITRPNVLVLDDIDLEPPSPWRESLLKVLVERVHSEEGTRTVLIANGGPDSWSGTLGERVADRMMENCYLDVPCVGDSLRRKD